MMVMARRQKAATTTASPTNILTKSDVTPSSLTKLERQNTNGRHGTITARAYALYEERGYRQGGDLQDWLDAEREILSRALPL
jgi:hypothetical protein